MCSHRLYVGEISALFKCALSDLPGCTAFFSHVGSHTNFTHLTSHTVDHIVTWVGILLTMLFYCSLSLSLSLHSHTWREYRMLLLFLHGPCCFLFLCVTSNMIYLVGECYCWHEQRTQSVFRWSVCWLQVCVCQSKCLISHGCFWLELTLMHILTATLSR